MDKLEKYGIKEVAEVTFYDIKKDVPVLYLDTLKVSNLEVTAETAEARGGRGNAALISWDYGREINVTLEDALFSMKSLAMMYGGKVSEDSVDIYKTVPVLISGTDNDKKIDTKWYDKDGEHSVPESADFYLIGFKNEDTNKITFAQTKIGRCYFAKFKVLSETTTNANPMTVEISSTKFPGTYKVVGETFMRNEETGEDEPFKFIIPKAKILSENTLTLEAEGDPTVFNMNLKVLRPKDGIMVKLIKYTPVNPPKISEGSGSGSSGSGSSGSGSTTETWTLNKTNTLGGIVTVSSTKGTVGQTVSVTITPADNYEIDSVLFNNISKTKTSSLTLTPVAGENELYVSFKEKSGWTITASVLEGGSGGEIIAQPANGEVGENSKILISVNSGYTLGEVTFNTIPITPSKNSDGNYEAIVTPNSGENAATVTFISMI